MPYEGQPFQNFIPQQFKYINNSIKIYGYVSHNLPNSFEMIYRNGVQIFYFFQSKDQIKYFQKI